MKHPLCAAACAAAVMATLGLAPARAAGAPRDFLKIAIKGDNSEIMLGRLGERRAATPAARNFSQTLVADHSRARSEAARLAARLHIRPPRGPEKEAVEERNRLRDLSGWAFDREFARYMVEDHHKDIAGFRAQAGANDGPVSALARHQLPTLRKHLDMALRLNARFGRYTEQQP
jgi:putative membrane protein